MRVIIQLPLNLFRPEFTVQEWRTQDVIQARAASFGQFRLPPGDIDVVIVDCVQRSSGGRRHPSGIRARLRMGDLGPHHLAHLIRHRPHPLADLRLPPQSCFNADVHVPVFVSLDPRLSFDLFLRQHRAHLHTGMDFVAGPIQESRVDKGHPLLCRPDAFFKIDSGAPLFVHDPDLEGVPLQAERLFHPGEQFHCGRDLFRSVLFRLDDVDAALFAVGVFPLSLEVMDGGQHRNHGVEKAFRSFLAVRGGYGIRVHMNSHIPNQEQASSRQGELSSDRRNESFIRVQPPGQWAAVFVEGGFERPFHDAAPMTIDGDLVGSVDRGHGILAVLDSGNRRLQHDVLHPGRMRLADRMASIDLNLDARSVIAQQDGGQLAVAFLIA